MRATVVHKNIPYVVLDKTGKAYFNETPTPASVIAPTTPTDTIGDNFLQTLINEQTEATAQAGKLRQLRPPRSPLIAEFHEANSHFMANNITPA